MKDLIISAKKAPSSTETGDLTVTGDSIGAGKTASEPHRHRCPSYKVCSAPRSPSSFFCCFCYQRWCLSIHGHYLTGNCPRMIWSIMLLRQIMLRTSAHHIYNSL